MREYEALVIVDARLEEGDIQKAVDRFSSFVGERGGEVGEVDRWGLRRLAYEINHQDEGYYFKTNFKAPEEAVEDLKRLLQISDDYVRGKIVASRMTSDDGVGTRGGKTLERPRFAGASRT